MAGFEYRGQISGAQDPIVESIIIAPSTTVTVGDAIYAVDGLAELCTNSTDIFGIVAGIVDKNGIDLDNTSSDNYDGTWTSSTQTYTSSSDNNTDKQVKVLVIVDEYAIFYNDADGDFTNPDDLYKHVKLVSESQIDESTTDDDVGQFQVWKLNPDADDDSSKCHVRISRWQGSAFEPEA